MILRATLLLPLRKGRDRHSTDVADRAYRRCHSDSYRDVSAYHAAVATDPEKIGIVVNQSVANVGMERDQILARLAEDGIDCCLQQVRNGLEDGALVKAGE